jgi:hypothetical protein
MIAAAVATAFGVALARVTCGFYLRLADLLRIGLATAVMALAVAVIPFSSSGSRLAIDVVGGATIYFGVIAILYPAVPRQIIEKFRARLRQRAA